MPEPDIGLSDRAYRVFQKTGTTYAWFGDELVVIRRARPANGD